MPPLKPKTLFFKLRNLGYQAHHDLDAYIRGIAEHYATDLEYAAKIIQLAHGPNVAAAIVAARNRDVA